MNRFTPFLFLIFLVFVIACQVDDTVAPPAHDYVPDLSLTEAFPALDDPVPIPVSLINREVWEQVHTTGPFHWDQANDKMLWSAVVQSDSLISIGYAVEGMQDLESTIHEIDVNDADWRAVREALIDFVVEQENIDRKGEAVTAKDLLAFGEKSLPYINIRISRYETLAQLRRMRVVRYVEPMGYGIEPDNNPAPRSGSGCGTSAASSLPSSDYTTITPGAKVSWNYYNHNIPAAWNQSQGDNITVGLIDSGISPSQSKLNNQFSSGYSTGRYRTKLGTFVTGWWWWASIDGPDDDCGHGTAMAGTIAAPRTSSGSTVGVAYKSNLVSIRGTDDVIINESREKDGVSDAYVNLGNRADVKIISMSLGDVFYSSQVADAVVYAYNKGKLIFNAAGTSLSWTSWWGVIFPATMSQTVAVTGVKTGSNMSRCDVCHDGSQVDFVVIMQDQNNSNRTPLTLYMSGNTPAYTGGSSIATATTAGIAALVWAKDPSQSRGTILQRLKDASSNYPSRNGNFGWGTIDALDAVNSVP